MGNIFLKRRSLYLFYYWCNRTIPEAEFRYEMADQALKAGKIDEVDISKIEKERDEAYREVFNYKTFLAELSDVEKEIVSSPQEPSNKLVGIKLAQFEDIRLEVFRKWCVKFLPKNIVYIREIDKMKLGKNLKESRLEKGYSAIDVCRYLGISEGALRNYENGNRVPSLSVFYVL
ncbi:MAG: helix-turn-helix transcriptional regulator, partial [Bacilli bacterium]